MNMNKPMVSLCAAVMLPVLIFAAPGFSQTNLLPNGGLEKDSNNDGVLKLSDAINTLNYLFKGGPPPPAPGPIECGIDDDAEGEQDFLGGICVCSS